MFHVQSFNPHALLRHCVDSYLIVSVDHPGGGYVENTFFPNVTQSLVFGLDRGYTVYDCTHSEYAAQNFIAGPNEEVCRVRLFPGMRKMIIHFKPGGFFKTFHLPAYFFNNRSQEAEKFLGKQVAEMGNQLRKTHLSRKIELLDAWLIEQLQNQKKTDRNIDDAIQLIERNKGNITLSELEEMTFTTKRTLERHFLEQVGLHPKIFSRLVRFNAVLRFIESGLNINWRQLAEVCGYYDQSHFINEFKSLTGGLPQDYFSLRASAEKTMQV